jgi:hypothetical protein
LFAVRCYISTPLERFPAKWIPVRVKKTRQTKKLESRSDSIGTERGFSRVREYRA